MSAHGIEEGGVHVEQDEDHADEVELDREALAGGADRRARRTRSRRSWPAFGPRPAQELGQHEREDAEAEGDGAEDQDRGVAGHEIGVPPNSRKAVSRGTIAFARTECQSPGRASAASRAFAP